ncbi:MAG: hypothetical protein WKF70_03760, partial [Chitinophagaceae bacterium]
VKFCSNYSSTRNVTLDIRMRHIRAIRLLQAAAMIVVKAPYFCAGSLKDRLSRKAEGSGPMTP